MRRIILLAAALFLLTGCGEKAPQSEEIAEPTQTKVQEETVLETANMIRLTVGEQSFLAELADNETAKELAELLKKGPITMSAYNYGGFEKVCALGTRLTSSDVQTTTQAGDIMLYSGNQIVIFYSSNSWAYTRLARVREEDLPQLQAILSGDEGTVTIELA